MSKVRVYEVARELGVENRDLIQRIATLGIQVRNHMSVLDPVEVDRIKRSLLFVGHNAGGIVLIGLPCSWHARILHIRINVGWGRGTSPWI